MMCESRHRGRLDDLDQRCHVAETDTAMATSDAPKRVGRLEMWQKVTLPQDGWPMSSGTSRGGGGGLVSWNLPDFDP
jgi:hypothetical protein